MKLRLLRHATLEFEMVGGRYLVDPMLGPAEAWDPVSNAPNPQRNPMVELPDDANRAISELSAVFVTHTHADHWDETAIDLVPSETTMFCQPHDLDTISGQGFHDVRGVEDELDFESLRIARTDGRHGTGEIAERIGPVSGFVVDGSGEPILYVAGDTVWCPEVEKALARHRPDVVVVNAGAAQFIDSDPITMDANDVATVLETAPEAIVVAVHMESINHCVLTRDELQAEIESRGLSERLWTPADGESRTF